MTCPKCGKDMYYFTQLKKKEGDKYALYDCYKCPACGHDEKVRSGEI